VEFLAADVAHSAGSPGEGWTSAEAAGERVKEFRQQLWECTLQDEETIISPFPARGGGRLLRETGQMCTLMARTSVLAALAATTSVVADPLLAPGLYQVEVRLTLPNVQNVAAPVVVTRCIRPSDLESGAAFAILSKNPLRTCELLDYQVTGGTASYRIACPGPNRGKAVALFDTAATTYRGSINMNMGGKNMTMSETQAGTRIGNCP
jgi:hypothetical protein